MCASRCDQKVAACVCVCVCVRVCVSQAGGCLTSLPPCLNQSNNAEATSNSANDNNAANEQVMYSCACVGRAGGCKRVYTTFNWRGGARATSQQSRFSDFWQRPFGPWT